MSEGRQPKAIFWLAAAAVMAAGSIREFLKSQHVELPWFIEIASPVAIYEGLYLLVDRYLWKYPPLRLIGWSTVPDLSGEWQAKFKTSYDQYATEHAGSVLIKQSWSSIHVWLETAQSGSHSEMATIVSEANGDQYLIYEYLNEPSASKSVATMHQHRGTCRLLIAPDAKTLKGTYYSGHDRQNHGELELTR